MLKQNHPEDLWSVYCQYLYSDTDSDLRPLQSMQSFAFKGFWYWNCEWLRTGTVHVLYCTDRVKIFWSGILFCYFKLPLTLHLKRASASYWWFIHKSFCKKEFLPPLHCMFNKAVTACPRYLENFLALLHKLNPFLFLNILRCFFWLEAHIVAHEKK